MRTLTFVLLPALIACTGPVGVDGGAFDAGSFPDAHDSGPTSDAGVLRDAGHRLSIGYTLFASGQCESGALASSCPVYAGMILEDSAGAPVEDATVTVNGTALATTPGAAGLYDGHLTGYVTDYEFVVTRGDASLTLHAPAASDFMPSLSPSPPTAGAEATVTWTPSGAPNVEVNVQVFDPDGVPSTTLTVADPGTVTIPAEAFSTSGTYRIDVQRRLFPPELSNTLAGGGSPPNFGLTRSITTTVP